MLNRDDTVSRGILSPISDMEPHFSAVSQCKIHCKQASYHKSVRNAGQFGASCLNLHPVWQMPAAFCKAVLQICADH